MSELLKRAREYEQKKMDTIPQSQRPVFHFSAPCGWNNDPNGFSMFGRECHLFFQYYPYQTVWGPMHWGHAKTKDFLHWEMLPAALAPDESYDNFGVFSGGAVEADGKQYLMYTGVVETVLPDGTKQVRQNPICSQREAVWRISAIPSCGRKMELIMWLWEAVMKMEADR